MSARVTINQENSNSFLPLVGELYVLSVTKWLVITQLQQSLPSQFACICPLHQYTCVMFCHFQGQSTNTDCCNACLWQALHTSLRREIILKANNSPTWNPEKSLYLTNKTRQWSNANMIPDTTSEPICSVLQLHWELWRKQGEGFDIQRLTEMALQNYGVKNITFLLFALAASVSIEKFIFHNICNGSNRPVIVLIT